MLPETHIRFLLYALLVMIVLPFALVAQETGTGSPAPIVVITRSDGSTLRGTVVSADPDQVVVQPQRKPGQNADPEKITLPWNQIKRMSNGLTQAKALEQWRQQNRDKLCDTCHGYRTLLCETCRGTAHDPKSAANCKTCKGELLVDCKQPKCDQGNIPCPAACLKLSDGQWYKKADGLQWRKFTTKGGYVEFSERHLGELVGASKDGKPENKGKCSTCGGTTQVVCTSCHGIQQVACPTCVARKDAPPCTASCKTGLVPCTGCSGSGLKS